MYEDNDRNEDILLFDEEEPETEFFDDPDGDDTDLLIDEGEDRGGRDSSQQVRCGGLRRSGNQMVGGTSLLTDVDLVFVIDCTGSMEPCLSMVKAHAKSLHNDIMAGLGNKSRQVHKLRVKVIAYRDYYFDWADPEHPPMTESEFFTLPEQEAEYAAFVDSLEYAGGEDEPESALEALHLAFHSKWMNDPNVTKKRQVVLLFTDASAHPLNDSMRYDPAFNSHYPEGMPESLTELQDEFMSAEVFPVDGNGYPTGHRLILFAPEEMEPWKQVRLWDETICRSMDPERGLEGLGMEDVIMFISGSL